MVLFLNMSGGEIFVIVLVAYLVLGPKKIPEVARMIGKGINEMRRATDDIRREINREVNNLKKETFVESKNTHIPEPYKRESTATFQESTLRDSVDTESEKKEEKDFR